jgi:tetratricopeptide (TPR) repeat protein
MASELHKRKLATRLSVLTISLLLAHIVATQKCFADPTLANRLSQRAMLEVTQGSTRQAALDHINQAISIRPKDALFWFQKAHILSSMEEDEEALPCIEKSLQLDPKLSLGWAMKANILCTLGKGAEALSAIDHAISLQDILVNRISRVTILATLHRPEEAEKELDYLVKQEPTNNIVRGRRAALAANARHWDKVIEDCTYLLGHEGHLKLTHLQHLERRAEAYTNTKQYDKAIADYKTALKLVPDDRTVHNGLRNVYKISGQPQAEQREAAAIKRLDGDILPPR